MIDKLKTKFQNKCIGVTDEGRDYIYGTDWKGYAKALEKQVGQTDCNCSAEETTGWTTFRLCNICGKIQKKDKRLI